MHRRKLWLFAGAVLLALALTATGSAKVGRPVRTPSRAGTIVFGAEQGGGPDWCLNQLLTTTAASSGTACS